MRPSSATRLNPPGSGPSVHSCRRAYRKSFMRSKTGRFWRWSTCPQTNTRIGNRCWRTASSIPKPPLISARVWREFILNRYGSCPALRDGFPLHCLFHQTLGRTLTLKYKDGEKKITVPASAPIVTYVSGDKSDIKPGAKVFIVAIKQADGTLQGRAWRIGRDGVTPPM
jgi:hypothetical protein